MKWYKVEFYTTNPQAIIDQLDLPAFYKTNIGYGEEVKICDLIILDGDKVHAHLPLEVGEGSTQ